MKKQQVRRKAQKKQKKLILPEARVITELSVWSFRESEEINRHIADELAKALQLNYHLNNFGPSVFGLEEEDPSDI